MNQQDIQRTSPELNKVKLAFETWRASKDKGSRIPQTLWEEAIALYPEFSVSKISTTLSLSYTDLKKRAENKMRVISIIHGYIIKITHWLESLGFNRFQRA